MNVPQSEGGWRVSVYMVSPPHTIWSEGREVLVYGWREKDGRFSPIVTNPDGPGIGPWEVYYGEDDWYAA